MAAEDIIFGLTELMLNRMGMFATLEGLDKIIRFIKGAGVATLFLIGAFLLVFVYWMLRDMFRFGRQKFPWWVGAVAGTLFGAAGFWAAGPAGVSAGAPFLIAFGLGRWKAGRKEKN